jgi:hypothetical protein
VFYRLLSAGCGWLIARRIERTWQRVDYVDDARDPHNSVQSQNNGSGQKGKLQGFHSALGYPNPNKGNKLLDTQR